jgi:hypothetical protein
MRVATYPSPTTEHDLTSRGRLVYRGRTMTRKIENFTKALGACLATTTSTNRMTLAAAYDALPSRLTKRRLVGALFATIEDACMVEQMQLLLVYVKSDLEE